jgi:hypothetical protein
VKPRTGRQFPLDDSDRVVTAIREHFTNCVADGETFQREQGALHPFGVIGRPLKEFAARGLFQHLPGFGQPKFANPIVADWSDPIHRPAGEPQFVVHGPSAVCVRGMDDDGTNREMTGEQLGYFETRARIAGCTGLRVQIVVEGNEMDIIEAIFAFGEHRWRVTPDTHLPVLAEIVNSRFETSNSFVVIFQEENRLHPNPPTFC